MMVFRLSRGPSAPRMSAPTRSRISELSEDAPLVGVGGEEVVVAALVGVGGDDSPVFTVRPDAGTAVA